MVRDLIPLAVGEAESPMESEARLVMIDGGLPMPELQYDVIDRDGRLWRLDFAWPHDKLAVEYDGFDWHSDPDSLRRDRQKRAALLKAHTSASGVSVRELLLFGGVSAADTHARGKGGGA